MTREEAFLFIKECETFGSVLGLDTMTALLKGLDNPQNDLKFIHIAGTNGKGSTAAFISYILAQAGYLVGRYISPSVFSYNEKIQTLCKDHMHSNKFIEEPIKDSEIITYIGKIKPVCQDMVKRGHPHPTAFEVETAMAMLYYCDKNCSLVVLEVGLGGRMDATNVITTTLCAVLTSISMDHMHILGNTLSQIAKEKAGIIKSGCRVVSYEQNEEAACVIKEVCKEKRVTLHTADFKQLEDVNYSLNGTIFSYGIYKELHISLLGENQIKNAVLAILAVEELAEFGFTIKKEQIRNGLRAAAWRGRFEIIQKKPLVIIDGAHNEDAAISLAANIKRYLGNRRIFFILGVLADKDYHAVLKHTGKYADIIYTITPGNSRGLDSEKLAAAAKSYCKQVINSSGVKEAVRSAMEEAGAEDVILAFGSLSYLKEVYDEIYQGSLSAR